MSNTSAGRSKWPYVPLTTVAEKIQDGTHFSPLSTSGPFRYVTSRNIRPGYLDLESCGWISEREHKAIFRRCDPRYGDILLTKDGANTGNASINTLHEEISLLSSVAMIRTDPTVADGHFVLQYLLSPEGQTRLTDLVSGNAITRLTLAKIKAFSIPSAPLPEQRAIAAVLDSLDDAIQKTEQIIAKLQQVKQGLLHDLLTRGIDDNGELRDPERHPEQFQDSPLGRIPKGWEVGTVAHWFEVTSGVTLGPHRIPRYNPKPYLRVANVQRSMLDLSEIAFLEARDAEISNKLLAVGDLLIVEGHADPREIGRCAIVPPEATDFTFQNHLFRLRSRSALPSYALLQLNSASTRRYWWRTCATSSGLHTINRAQLARLKIAMASTHEQAAICSLADTTDLRILEEERAVGVLRAIRSGLAEDLLYGRVRTTSLPEFSA